MNVLTAEKLEEYLCGLAKSETEHAEQRTFFAWLAYHKAHGIHPDAHMAFAIPNGGQRGKAAAGRFKAEGVKAGVPDTMYPVPRGCYAGLFIELKATGGRASDKQQQWHTDLREKQYAVAVCWGWRAAVACFCAYEAGQRIEEQYK